MNTKKDDQKLYEHQFFNTISADLNFPAIDPDGKVRWYQSQINYDNMFFQRIALAEDYCSAIKHSKGHTFWLDKSLQGTSIRKEYPAGELFYRLMSLGLNRSLPQYELPEHFRLLTETAKQIGVTQNLFFQHDPLLILTADGLRQAELIESFGRRVFERITTKGFSERCAHRKREISAAATKSGRYFRRIMSNYQPLCFLRFELQHKIEYSVGITIDRSAEQLSTLIKTLNCSKDEKYPGFWWKRRMLPECSFAYHFVLAFNPQHIRSELVIADLCERWAEITEAKGFAIFLNDTQDNYRSWGSGISYGMVASPNDLVLRSVLMMFEAERYIRLMPHPRYPHFGMGELPAEVRRDKTWLGSLHMPSLT